MILSMTERPAEVQRFVCEPGTVSVLDGDSFTCNKRHIRVVGVDAPEIAVAGCPECGSQPSGHEARQLVVSILSSARSVVCIAVGQDDYGRILAFVLADGRLIEASLLGAGLAYETISVFGDHGMHGFGMLILLSSWAGPSPQFQRPYIWRREHHSHYGPQSEEPQLQKGD
jgi:endonuclease YncB( thermonuclease family)